MNELEKQEELLDKMNKAKNKIQNRITTLKKDSNVKRYLKLENDLEEINQDYDDLKYQYTLKKCECCNHLFVVSGKEEDYIEGRTYYEFGCLKCGVDTHLYELNEIKGFAPYIEYMKNNHLTPQNNTGLYYNNFNEFLNARELYLELKEKNKAASDKEIIKMLKMNKEKKR